MKMANVINFVNTNFKWIIIAAISFVLIFGNLSSCNNQKKLYEKIGELTQITQNNAKVIGELKDDNAKLDAANKTLLFSIEELKKTSESTNKKIDNNSNDIKKLRETRPEYDAVCQPIVDHMQAEIDKITENFNLAIYDRDTWMQNTYNAELGWKNEHKIVLNKNEEIRLMAEESAKKDEVMKEMQKTIKNKGLKANIIVGGMVAIVVGFVILGFMK
jgi:hypothetical protein